MTEVMIKYLNENGVDSVNLCVFGHSGYADKGQDIVCASISSITQLVLNHYQNKRETLYVVEKEDVPSLEATILPKDISLINEVVSCYQELEKEFPNHIKLKIIDRRV